ncbi:prepilin peptidase [Candidatus Dependentiae bacterium]|nr:prepilin peptidase [Candidatus Dependentiae bacterium]
MIIFILLLILLFLIYGSFLNMLSYRLISGDSLLISRSFCPNCKKTISWYDLIPVISWLNLKGKCRNCKKNISFLYPFIEILTALIFTLMILTIEPKFWLSYFLYFSAMIITIRTDLEFMLISRFATLFLIPFAFIFAYFNLLEINLIHSILGFILGYSILALMSFIFFKIKRVRGMGEGDPEMLATIGAFTGPIGAWAALTIGATLGSIYGIYLLVLKKADSSTRIPFGPLLAFGSIIYVFLKRYFNV